MNRRVVLTGLVLATALVAAWLIVRGGADRLNPQRPLNIAQFETDIASLSPARIAELDRDLITATIPQVQEIFAQGKLTSEELVKYQLWRIHTYDVNKLNSVTELNPDALEIARQLDAERAARETRGPLHGTTVLLKDVIGTGDKMHNTAGALALADAKSDRDAFVVQKLRDAGVIVLGKAALTEWQSFIALKQASGYSTLGGQTYNPYNDGADVRGSSTGSAVATAANFASFALGAETAGSLILPAVANGAAAFKPSMGMVSRDRIIPQLDSQDIPGPVTRYITDLALVMDAIVGTDANDPVTIAASTVPKEFGQNLDVNPLRGLRIGLLPTYAPEDKTVHEQMTTLLRNAGVDLFDLPRQPDLYPAIFDDLDPITAYSSKLGVEKYLAETNAPIKTIGEIVAFNAQDLDNRARYGQEYLEMTVNSTMSSTEYATRARAMSEKARRDIDGLMASDRLDFIAGTHLSVPFTVYYPGAGYPAVAIQAGYRADGSPVGFVLTGKLFDDTRLVRVAYALEQAAKAWIPPALE